MCVILEITTQNFINFNTFIITDDFPTIIKLGNYWREGSIRGVKNSTIKMRRIYVGMANGCTVSYSTMNLANTFRENSSTTIRTVSTIFVWVENVRIKTEDKY